MQSNQVKSHIIAQQGSLFQMSQLSLQVASATGNLNIEMVRNQESDLSENALDHRYLK